MPRRINMEVPAVTAKFSKEIHNFQMVCAQQLQRLAAFALLGGVLACGPTIGDACTTAQDCGRGTCLNFAYTPGGYCSKSCAVEADCPQGTRCVPNGAAAGEGACFLVCDAQASCRTGYECRVVTGQVAQVCVGPTGI
jgi:hypothetical protein